MRSPRRAARRRKSEAITAKGRMPPVDRVLAAVDEHGLLLVQDVRLPSVVAILTGETPRGSWWSHPKGKLVFAVLGMLADHPKIVFTKLLSGKQTLVHRRLWPDLLAAGSAGESWQTRGLSAAARSLLRRLASSADPVRASGAAPKELEARLLAVTREVHTESGRHETALETWQAWAARVGCKPRRSASKAQTALERAARSIGASREALPWVVYDSADQLRAKEKP
jgi:hypothetical protein